MEQASPVSHRCPILYNKGHVSSTLLFSFLILVPHVARDLERILARVAAGAVPSLFAHPALPMLLPKLANPSASVPVRDVTAHRGRGAHLYTDQQHLRHASPTPDGPGWSGRVPRLVVFSSDALDAGRDHGQWHPAMVPTAPVLSTAVWGQMENVTLAIYSHRSDGTGRPETRQ